MESPTAPLLSAFMHDLAKQLVPLIVAELKAQTNAEGMGMIALDPNNISLPMYTVLKEDIHVRALIEEIVENYVDPHITSISRKVDELDTKVDELNDKVEDLDDISDIKSRVSTLEEKVGELEENSTPIDADDGEFSEAVLQVLRNNI